MTKKVFIAAPMSAFDNDAYIESRSAIIELIKQISYFHKNAEVFYAGNPFNEQTNFQDPKESIKTDLQTLDESHLFILIYMEPVASSALIETGYAIKSNKKIGVFTDKRTTLPFLIREIDTVYPNVQIIETEKNNLTSEILTYINSLYKEL